MYSWVDFIFPPQQDLCKRAILSIHILLAYKERMNEWTYRDLPHKKQPRKVPQLLHPPPPPPPKDLPRPDRPPPKRKPKIGSAVTINDKHDIKQKKAKRKRALIIMTFSPGALLTALMSLLTSGYFGFSPSMMSLLLFGRRNSFDWNGSIFIRGSFGWLLFFCAWNNECDDCMLWSCC